MNNQSPIYVTRPTLPELDLLRPMLEKIWSSRVLTNGGEFHKSLESALKDYLKVPEVSLFCNGTIALIVALQALGIKGKVITTPYSFVATSHSLLWNSIEPIFVDIDPKTFNIDPAKIEQAITPEVSAILAVHCYGVPCDVEAIDQIAKKYDLKVIYDAAHAFGVECHCGSLLNHGDLSVLSFHATKVFNTFEGGAIVSPNPQMKTKIDQLKNFGFVDEVTVVTSGINGKMSELNAAIGLLQLESVDQAIEARRAIDQYYRGHLAKIDGISCMDLSHQIKANYSYFPVLIEDSYHLTRDQLYHRLRDYDIYARRYFYPLITDFPMYQHLFSARADNLPNAQRIAKQILCLPIYPGLSREDQDFIMRVVKGEF